MQLNVERYIELLRETKYNEQETDFLSDGFTNGFDISYEGPQQRHSRSQNIPFTVGNKYELWSKIMKEVKGGRFAGPYEEIPYENFIQSPIGLVPKAGNKTRLIFHLSYDFPNEETEGTSLNGCTPRDKCTVKYNDLDTAVKQCLLVAEKAECVTGNRLKFVRKTDLSMAFRVLPLKVRCYCWMVLMAEDPLDGRMKFFIDKCLPFGASISYSHYQHFSNSLKHILQY